MDPAKCTRADPAAKRVCTRAPFDTRSTIVPIKVNDRTTLYIPHTFIPNKKPIGQGSFGCVYICHNGDQKLAVKKMFTRDLDAFKREVAFLTALKGIPLFAQLYNFYDHEDLYILCDAMDTNLNALIKDGQVTEDKAAFFMVQIIHAVFILHRANLIHRDLKPANILVRINCDIQICDFGCARGLEWPFGEASSVSGASASGYLTSYLCTRWYRAPEIVFHGMPGQALSKKRKYGLPIDMWSIGCILAEMLSGKALLPGCSNCEQMAMILDLYPTSETKVESQIEQKWIDNFEREHESVASRMWESSEDAKDIINKLLQFHEDKRLTAEQAVHHPYVTKTVERYGMESKCFRYFIPDSPLAQLYRLF
jgi:serine/threonine protein kinase